MKKKYYQVLHEDEGVKGGTPPIIINMPPTKPVEPPVPSPVKTAELEQLKLAEQQRLQLARDAKIKEDAIKEYQQKLEEEAKVKALETEKKAKSELVAKIKEDDKLKEQLEKIGANLETASSAHLNMLLKALGKSFELNPTGVTVPGQTIPPVTKKGGLTGMDSGSIKNAMKEAMRKLKKGGK